MRRVAYILGLLLPLAAGAAQLPGTSGPGDTNGSSHHVWPATALFATDASEANPPSAFPSDSSTEVAVRALRQATAEPSPAEPPSFQHLDLSQNVRLALLTAPRWANAPRGVPTLEVSLLSLRW
jgi:hypothetical protein